MLCFERRIPCSTICHLVGQESPLLSTKYVGMNQRTEQPLPTFEEVVQQNTKLENQVTELKIKLAWYEEQFRKAQHQRFAASSERTHPDQLTLFNEAEAEADPKQPEPTLETVTVERRKKTAGHRETKLAGLPVETVTYTLSAAECICPDCAGPLHEMSTEVRRELKIIPAQVSVVEHVRPIHGCRYCEQNGLRTPIITAPMPAPALPGSLASPSMLAYVMRQKYVDSLPLYRQEQQFRQLGIELSRQTMANWLIAASERWLDPLYRVFHAKLLEQEIVLADETTLQVLREPGRAAQTKSYLWLYRTGRVGIDVVLYDYRTGRGGEHPEQFLSGFNGYLQTDGYSGYAKVKGITQLGCWAHARRKYYEAMQVAPPAQRAQTVAAEGLAFCNALFEVERRWKMATPEERYTARLAESKPILERFAAWLKEQQLRALPKGLLGTAITYSLKQWEKLNVFLQDGRLEIDNNRSERAIKPTVIGRKNFLFSNTPRGAKASAILYSIVETAKANGLKPEAYLQYLFEQLPQLPDHKDRTSLEKLAPWSPSLPITCRLF
jgi:transposase